MKIFLLPLLACGMCVSATAQPEVSDKWVITPVTNMKGVLGMLDINFPADVERNILIYQQADNKFLRSVSRNDKTYPIAPGEYRFTLTSVPVENVPIKKGHETRLKAGFLDIVSEGDWHLYDETKEKAYTSGNKPKKLPLPVGRYQVKLGGQYYPVIIKDGETVEDYSTVEEEIATSVKEAPPKWEITPTKDPGKGMGKDSGFLKFTIPSFIYFSKVIYKSTGEYVNPGTDLDQSPTNQDAKHKLLQGVYNIKMMNVYVNNVPITEGQQTRIKVGFLKLTPPNNNILWSLLDKSTTPITLILDRQNNPWPDLNKPIALPEGTYQLFYYDKYWPVIIKDGKTNVFVWPQ